MLTFAEGSPSLSRRRFLRAGTLGLGGLSLTSLLAHRAAGNDSGGSVTGRSVIFVFQQGGPSQFETFDPKPDAPDGIRTLTGAIPTALPGVQFGSHLPQLAKLADRLTVVRSFQTNNAGHNIQPIVGPDSLQANIGCHYARVVGPARSDNGMPTNVVLFNDAVDDSVVRGKARGDIRATGPWSSVYAPFVPGSGGDLQQDMQLNLPAERLFEERREVLSQLDRLNREMDSRGEMQALDDLQQQAFRLLLGGGVSRALDLSQEDPQTLERFDTSRYVQNWNGSGRGKRGYYTGQAKTLGKLLLLARRLCEAGCGYVTVHADYEGVWDMHADGNNLNIKDGMDAVGSCFDHAVAALIEDIEARGLSEKILVVCCGEMGRTPRVNRNGGRDHWARLAPLMIYGGGTPGGRVIGRSTRDGGEPQGDNVTPKELIATILQTVFDVGQLRLQPTIPPELLTLAQRPGIPGLV